MKKIIFLIVATAIILPINRIEVLSQTKRDKEVLGNGGANFIKNSENIKSASTTGQAVTSEVSVNTDIGRVTLYQGFWVPSQGILSGIGSQSGDLSSNQLTNFPNPFNITTKIIYTLSTGAAVTLKVYNVSGMLIKTLVNYYQASGHYQIDWDAKDEFGQNVPSGSYAYELLVAPNQANSSSNAEPYSLRNVMVVIK
ncbi:MAG: hypothetical protein NT007_15690 [Candidatus Kapabacteria bacterium]|nr:hypothetical protein [Candidatus Kapabacteria bacterium]